MKRKNFYILLGLSIEPPEEDPKKIKAAIKKKQTEWNRLLHHPAIGTQAKNLISIIPEIQKIMADPDLRKKEAINAKKLMEKKNQHKFLTIDRQLSIFLSKGKVTSREIQKLVKLHSVETDEILKWMLKKEKETASKTPAAGSSQKLKDELKTILTKLAIRIKKGPVKKEEVSDKQAKSAHDVSRDNRIFKLMDSDIKMAEMDGVVRYEYFEAIASNAVKLGMDYKEVCKYIEAYCKKKNWKTKSKRKRKQMLLIGVAAILFVLIVSIGSGLLISASKNRRLSEEYEGVMAKVKIQKELEKKKKVLTEYVKSSEKSDFTEKAGKEIQTLTSKIILRNSRDEKDYKAALVKAADANASQNYEKSGAVYASYLKKYPNGIHVDEFRKKRSEIPALIDKRDFQAIKNLSDKDYDNILEACTSYLKNHPKGRHRDETANLIAGMEDPYYDFLKNKVAINEKDKNWKECISLCEKYFRYFPGGHYFNELKGVQLFFKKQLDNKIALEHLIQKAEKNEDSKESAKKIYTEYLQANPNSPIKYDVRKRLKELSE